MISASTLLPMYAKDGYRAEYIFFGGGDNAINKKGLRDVARMVITDPIKKWTYDSDLMPYGRVVSDAVIQPNGKILIFNGARNGQTGGLVGFPLMYGAANGKNIISLIIF